MAREEHPRTAPGVDRDVRVPIFAVITAALLILATAMVFVVVLRPGVPRGVNPPAGQPSRGAAVIVASPPESPVVVAG